MKKLILLANSFDLSKACDSVPHNILCEKLKKTNLNPYIINWILNFLANRKQRVAVDGIVKDFLDINGGVLQGTVIGPFLFSVMVNDINLEDPESNLLIKFADDLTIRAPVKTTGDSVVGEVRNIKLLINMSKTWEMIVRGRTMKPLPLEMDGIERKNWLKISRTGFSG